MSLSWSWAGIVVLDRPAMRGWIVMGILEKVSWEDDFRDIY
jgi:hypothetical protein